MNNFNNQHTASSINSAEMLEELEKTMAEKRAREEDYKNRNLAAVEQTAKNTKETNDRLINVIDDQHILINVLKEQLSLSRAQLDTLTNIFASNEDAYNCEREIAELIKKQIDDKHPLWDYVNGISQNLVAEGIIKSVPIIYSALKTYLASKGILLP